MAAAGTTTAAAGGRPVHALMPSSEYQKALFALAAGLEVAKPGEKKKKALSPPSLSSAINEMAFEEWGKQVSVSRGTIESWIEDIKANVDLSMLDADPETDRLVYVFDYLKTFFGPSLDENLEKRGEERLDTRPDGTCQFAAAARCLLGAESAWEEVRDKVADVMVTKALPPFRDSHPLEDSELVAHSLGLFKNYEMPDGKMRFGPRDWWGNHYTLAGIAEAYACTIVVVQPGLIPVEVTHPLISIASCQIVLAYKGEHYEAVLQRDAKAIPGLLRAEARIQELEVQVSRLQLAAPGVPDTLKRGREGSPQDPPKP